RNFPSMRLGNSTNDGQPQAGAPAFPAARGIGTVEAVEDMAKLLRRHAAAAILDANLYHPINLFNFQQNMPASGRMAQGVADQVVQTLAQPRPVGLNGGQVAQQFGV